MKLSPLSLAVCLGLQATTMQTQAKADIHQFDEVLVSATRMAETTSNTSRAVTVVSEEELALTQPQSVPQALATNANINTSNGPRASSQGVEIRGLAGERVLQTVDGARQNAASGHRGTYFMDPEMLKSVEVIKGPASSLWGSGAVGGVVAQNTKSAKDLLEPDQSIGGYAKQAYETNGDRLKSSGAVYGQQGQFDWLVNGSYFDSNNIKVGNDKTLENSGSHGNSGMIKLAWQKSDEHRLEFNGRLNNINETVPSNPATNVGSSVPLVKRNTQDKNISVNYQLSPSDNPYLNTKALVYFNDSKYDEGRIEKKQQDTTRYQTLGVSLSNTSHFNSTKLTYGFDGYKDELNTVRDDSGEAGNRPDNIDATAEILGGFVQASIPLGEQVTFRPALRYDSYKNTSKSLNTSASDSHVSPSAGLVWNTTEWLTLNARYDQAFRAPSMTEMYSTGSHFCMGPMGCNEFQINENLAPETAENKEIKAHIQFNDLVGDDEIAMTFNLFRNDIDDFILQVLDFSDPSKPAGTTSWQNVQNAKLEGFEFNTLYRFEQTRINVSYGQTKGTDKDNGEYLEGIPANKLVMDLSQGILEGDVKFGTRVIYHASQDHLPTDYRLPDDAGGKFDSYTLWDLYFAWEPAMGKFTGLRVDAAIENITDKEYRQAWQTLYSQGRNAKLSLRYMF